LLKSMAKCVQRSNGDVLAFWPCEQQPPCIEGWLKRRRGLVAAWHKVFVKIDGHQHKLRLYKRQTDTTPKTSVPLKYPLHPASVSVVHSALCPFASHLLTGPLRTRTRATAHAHPRTRTRTREHRKIMNVLTVDGEGSAAAVPSASPADSKKKEKEKKAKADAAGKYEFEVHTAARHYRFQANSESEMYARGLRSAMSMCGG